jgi:hypothetical protein
MKRYKNKITLNKNNRGCYILDTVKGCSITHDKKPNGCYGDCYAKKIAYRYGYDFANTVKRDFTRDTDQLYFFGFKDENHESKIVKEIKKIDMSFVRIGEMGDPSENWEHTIDVCKTVSLAGKPIVIITKHWKQIPKKLLGEIKKLNLYIHTSISALDDELELNYRLNQYDRLKNYCNSFLRIVSCDFNKSNREGFVRAVIQDELFKNDNVIDTVFRPSKNNPLVTKNIINVEKVKFLNSNVIASVYNNYTYMGHCSDCPDMCGVKTEKVLAETYKSIDNVITEQQGALF